MTRILTLALWSTGLVLCGVLFSGSALVVPAIAPALHVAAVLVGLTLMVQAWLDGQASIVSAARRFADSSTAPAVPQLAPEGVMMGVIGRATACSLLTVCLLASAMYHRYGTDLPGNPFGVPVTREAALLFVVDQTAKGAIVGLLDYWDLDLQTTLKMRPKDDIVLATIVSAFRFSVSAVIIGFLGNARSAFGVMSHITARHTENKELRERRKAQLASEMNRTRGERLQLDAQRTRSWFKPFSRGKLPSAALQSQYARLLQEEERIAKEYSKS